VAVCAWGGLSGKVPQPVIRCSTGAPGSHLCRKFRMLSDASVDCVTPRHCNGACAHDTSETTKVLKVVTVSSIK
jgi:hypothetical protein